MQVIQPSRRIFLSNLALLAAGAVWGSSVSPFFPGSRPPSGPESTWKTICTRYKGSPGRSTIGKKKEIHACKGHRHQEGEPVYFPAENIKAQPVWIYWANNKRPSDLIVHFYKDDDTVITLNRYELQALLLPDEAVQKNRMHRLTTILKVNEKGQRILIAKTTVYRNQIRTVCLS